MSGNISLNTVTSGLEVYMDMANIRNLSLDEIVQNYLPLKADLVISVYKS